MKIKRKCDYCKNVFKVDFRWLGESLYDKYDINRSLCSDCIDKLIKFMDFNDED